MIDLVYSAQESGFERGFRYCNPMYFAKPKKWAKSIIVVGDWPDVVKAYEAQGAEVTVLKPGTPIREIGQLPPPAAANKPTGDADAPKVGKGPGGKWYIKRGKKNEAGPFATEAEAQAELDIANAATPDGTPLPIPEDWEALPEDEVIALAAALIGEDAIVSEETTVIEKAKSIISATVADRAQH